MARSTPPEAAPAPRPIRDRLALLALAVFASLVPLATVPVAYDAVVLPRLALTTAATGFVLVVLAMTGARLTPMPRDRAAVLMAICTVTTTMIATAFGADPIGSLLGEFQRYQGLLPTVLYLCLMAASALAVRQAGGVRPLLWGLFAGGALSASYAVADLAGWGWVTWRGIPTDRSVGLFGQPNVLAIELVCALSASFGLWSAARARSRDVLAVGLSGIVGVLLLTFSRAGWLAAAAALLVYGILQLSRIPSMSGRFPVAMGIIASGVVVLAIARPDSLERLSDRAGSIADGGGQSTRLGLWSTGLEMFADQPLAGSGPDSFPVRFPEYRREQQPGIGSANVRAESSHNLLIDRLVDSGVLGTACFVALVGTVVVPAAAAARRRGSPELAALVATLAAYYCATAFSFAEAMTGWIPWVVLGASLGLAEGTFRGGLVPMPAALKACVLAAGLLVAAAAVPLMAADLAAGRGEQQSRDGDAAAAESVRAAAAWNPLNRNYLRLQAAVETEAGDDVRALGTLHRLNSLFAPTADSLLAEAEALQSLHPRGEQNRRILALVYQAERLDIYNQQRADRAVALLDGMVRE